MGLRGVAQETAIGSTDVQVGGTGDPIDMRVPASPGDLVVVQFAADSNSSDSTVDGADRLWDLGLGQTPGVTSAGYSFTEVGGDVDVSGTTSGQFIIVGFAVKPALAP